MRVELKNKTVEEMKEALAIILKENVKKGKKYNVLVMKKDKL
jgi:hypothetical protein